MKPNWKPLEEKIGKERCAGFMFMGRINGINLYKHDIARMYLNLDDSGRCYAADAGGRLCTAEFSAELARIDAALGQLGETLETVYDETFIAKKYEALLRAGISSVRIEIEPQNFSVN